MSAKILAAVLSLGLLTAGAGVYAYSQLNPTTSLSEEVSDQPTPTEAAPASGCAAKSCCH